MINEKTNVWEYIFGVIILLLFLILYAYMLVHIKPYSCKEWGEVETLKCIDYNYHFCGEYVKATKQVCKRLER